MIPPGLPEISLLAIHSFLFVVLGAYRQMHQQQDPILTDVNEDNFDAAFALFRPGLWVALPDSG